MRTDIFVLKLGPLYLKSSPTEAWTHDPAEAVKGSLSLIQVLKHGSGEVIAIHPSETPTFRVKCDYQGGIYLSDFVTDNQGAAISEALLRSMDYPHTDIIIEVEGTNAYLNQSGFSHKPEKWEMQSSGWLSFEAKGEHTSEHGKLVVGFDSLTRKVIQGSWLGDVDGKLTSHGKVFRYNPNSFKKAVEWLNKLEGSE